MQSLVRYRWGIIVFILAATIAALIVSIKQAPSYVTSVSISVNRIHQQQTGEYQFDGYYAIQASDLFSQTILSWFLTPSVILEFYQKAEVDPEVDSLGALVGRFRARKFSAQNVVVQFSDPNKANAEKLAIAIGDVIKEKGEALNRDEENQGLFHVDPAEPVIVETRPNAILNTIAAAIASALIAFAAIAAVRYMRS